jgi:SAM-dependent methyltransferase
MSEQHHWTVEDVCDASGDALAQRTEREHEDVRAFLDELGAKGWTRPWREREAAEVGCGYGRMLPSLMDNRHFGRTTGFEREPNLILAADALVSAAKYARLFQVESLADLRYGPEDNERVSDGYFDFVMTFTVLQHLHMDDAVEAICELRRVSRQYILLCEETDTTLRGLNTTGGYSTWGRPWEWYQIEMEHRRGPAPIFKMLHMRRRRVEDGYPRKHCGTYMLFERAP